MLNLTGALALVLSVTACPGPETPGGEPTVLMSSSRGSINDKGETTTIRVSAFDARSEPGTGEVQFTTSSGHFANDQKSITVTLASGIATTTFACPRAQDATCQGSVSISAQWGQITSKVNVQVGAATTTDAGTDAGTNTGTDGGITPPKTDGGTDAGTDAGTNGATLALAASKNPIFYNVGDSSQITATLKRTNGTPWAGETIEFNTTLGGLTPAAGGTPDTQTLSATTAADGTAAVRFMETGSAGTATIQAKHLTTEVTKSVQVNVTTVQQITHKSTLCNGSACTIMGVRGSGFNEQAQITFSLKDSANQPASGVKVTFSIPNAPKETTVTTSGTTNAQGEVTATVSAGLTIGAFVVHATAIPGKVEVDSPTIGIRGAKPSNDGFSLKCDLVNIAAYVSADPPAAFEINCKVKVVDRFNNPVGTGTAVNFKSEAGNITTSVNTTAYLPTGSNTAEGEGTAIFKTRGGTFFPVDVLPLEEMPAQFPFPRYKEPRIFEGQLERNPRDSLVTIIAYTRGEEHFSDDNNNGVRDLSEQFIDQGEPFVDGNDNGVRDDGETYIDEAPADGRWNGPNGTWDKDTTIWTEVFILYSGRPAAQNSVLMVDGFSYPPQHTTFSGPCGSGVQKGSIVTINGYFADAYYNRPQAASTTFQIAHTAGKGGVASLISGLQDGYGFGIERRKLNPVDGKDCTPSTKVCNWRTLFYKWGYGYVGDFVVRGASPTDVTPCQSDTVSITGSVIGQGLTLPMTGAIE
jgi:hypothetical protein